MSAAAIPSLDNSLAFAHYEKLLFSLTTGRSSAKKTSLIDKDLVNLAKDLAGKIIVTDLQTVDLTAKFFLRGLNVVFIENDEIAWLVPVLIKNLAKSTIANQEALLKKQCEVAKAPAFKKTLDQLSVNRLTSLTYPSEAVMQSYATTSWLAPNDLPSITGLFYKYTVLFAGQRIEMGITALDRIVRHTTNIAVSSYLPKIALWIEHIAMDVITKQMKQKK